MYQPLKMKVDISQSLNGFHESRIEDEHGRNLEFNRVEILSSPGGVPVLVITVPLANHDVRIVPTEGQEHVAVEADRESEI